MEHGFRDWRELEAFTRSVPPGSHVLSKPLPVVVRKGVDDWEPIAASRDWDEIIELLTRHPEAGLGGVGQLTDGLLDDLSQRVRTLTALSLSGCREVTDAGVMHLAQLPLLRHLDMSGTAITDGGLEVLRHLPVLQSLSLGWTRVTDGRIGVLAQCDALEQLSLGPSRRLATRRSGRGRQAQYVTSRSRSPMPECHCCASSPCSRPGTVVRRS